MERSLLILYGSGLTSSGASPQLVINYLLRHLEHLLPCDAI